VKINNRRINGYLSDMVAEMEDIQSVLAMPDKKIVQDHHMVKSLKFSTIIIAESVGNILQHFLAKKERVAAVALRILLYGPETIRLCPKNC